MHFRAKPCALNGSLHVEHVLYGERSVPLHVPRLSFAFYCCEVITPGVLGSFYLQGARCNVNISHGDRLEPRSKGALAMMRSVGKDPNEPVPFNKSCFSFPFCLECLISTMTTEADSSS